MEDNMNTNIGDKIKTFRAEAQITQEQLAQAIGVKRSVISKYENGSVEPSLSQLQRIAKALGVSWYELMGLRDEISALETLTNSHPGFSFVLGSNGDICSVSKEFIEKFFSVIPPVGTPLGNLLLCFGRLNEKGQEIAVQRVNELGKIPEYRENPLPSSTVLNSDEETLTGK